MTTKPSVYDREAQQADQLAAILERVAIRQEDRVFGHYTAGHFDRALKEARALEVVSYKAASDGTAGLDADLLDVIAGAIDVSGKEAVTQTIVRALRTLVQPALKPTATVTDSGLMSAQKAVKRYQPTNDPYATGAGADQLDQAPRAAGVDLRPR